MPRATCRCGYTLKIPDDSPDRVVCPQCGAKIRVRRKGPRLGDGFLRFSCPCGRRLKVKVDPDRGLPGGGKCPDCGRIVSVRTRSSSDGTHATGRPESTTEELSAADLAMLDEWSRRRQAGATTSPPAEAPTVLHPAPSPSPSAVKIEAGLRVCPRCGKPVHLNAIACRECGAHVPKR